MGLCSLKDGKLSCGFDSGDDFLSFGQTYFISFFLADYFIQMFDAFSVNFLIFVQNFNENLVVLSSLMFLFVKFHPVKNMYVLQSFCQNGFLLNFFNDSFLLVLILMI
jgi:hypothetical protein